MFLFSPISYKLDERRGKKKKDGMLAAGRAGLKSGSLLWADQ